MDRIYGASEGLRDGEDEDEQEDKGRCVGEDFELCLTDGVGSG